MYNFLSYYISETSVIKMIANLRLEKARLQTASSLNYALVGFQQYKKCTIVERMFSFNIDFKVLDPLRYLPNFPKPVSG